MGHGLWVHCENRECLHRAHIDLEAIAERYGAELSVAEFVNAELQHRLTGDPSGGTLKSD
jgi:hypothetical protein